MTFRLYNACVNHACLVDKLHACLLLKSSALNDKLLADITEIIYVYLSQTHQKAVTIFFYNLDSTINRNLISNFISNSLLK